MIAHYVTTGLFLAAGALALVSILRDILGTRREIRESLARWDAFDEEKEYQILHAARQVTSIERVGK